MYAQYNIISVFAGTVYHVIFDGYTIPVYDMLLEFIGFSIVMIQAVFIGSYPYFTGFQNRNTLWVFRSLITCNNKRIVWQAIGINVKSEHPLVRYYYPYPLFFIFRYLGYPIGYTYSGLCSDVEVAEFFRKRIIDVYATVRTYPYIFVLIFK